METATNDSVRLRRATADDESFLFELYRSVRAEEMAAWGLDSAQQEMILKLQFTAQQRHYDIAFAGADHQIIILNEQPAGRIMVYRSESEVRLVDIALLSEHRGKGVGAMIVSSLIEESRAASKPVTLHVAKDNRAARLYERLGFQITGDTGSHYKMEWWPKD